MTTCLAPEYTPTSLVSWIQETFFSEGPWLRNLEIARAWANDPSKDQWEWLTVRQANVLLDFARLPRPRHHRQSPPQELADRLDRILDNGALSNSVAEWAKTARNVVGDNVAAITRYVTLCREWPY